MDTVSIPARTAPPSSPFARVTPGVSMALLYLVAAGTWLVVDALPGGRWLALHLFTLGVITNLVLVFSQHFGQTLARSRTTADLVTPVVVLNGGVLLVLGGMTAGLPLAVGGGATIVTGVVLQGYLRLRRMRRAAVGARFSWIVRLYERAHGAFVHGAALGALLGVGALSGAWYGPARLAHVHVNVLGWAGLTLLATLVFFGPTMLRRRIESGADDRAAVALRHGATGLTLAVLLLLAMGAGGTVGSMARFAAAVGLGLYAWSVSVVCLPVARVARESDEPAARGPILAACLWFPAVAWADVAVVLTGQWAYLDALGVAVVLGVLLQAIVAALVYVAPMLLSARGGRERLRVRLGWAAMPRTVVYNAGVVLLVVLVL